MGRKRKGAFTLYFGVIFMSVLLIGLSVMDFARMNVYKTQAQRAMEITANSLITKYDKSFQENYGLFMAPSNNLQERADFLMKENFQAGSLSGAEKSFRPVSMNAAEVKEQILEYMKFRGPLVIVSKVYSMFSSFKSITSSGDKFTDRLDTELSNSDFLDALNEYRYYVHGWTFHDDKPDYKYIAQAGDANGYFVRSFIDFAAENPYAPHIDMANRSLFHDALADFDVDGYAAHFNKSHAWEGGDRLEESSMLDFAMLAAIHDWQIAAYLAVLEEQREAGAEGLDDKIDILKKMGIHDSFPDMEKMVSLSKYDYTEYNDPAKFLSLMKLLEYYVDYYEAQTEEEKAQPVMPIENGNDLFSVLNYINIGLNKDARWLETSNRLTQKNYRILQGMKASNQKAKQKLKDVAKELDDYEAQVRAEKNNLANSQDKDPNYVAKTEPLLEDKLEMIALMREKLKEVRDDGQFDQNVALLDDMIALLCVPSSPSYGSVDYYELAADDPEAVLLKDLPNVLSKKMKSTKSLLKERDRLFNDINKIRNDNDVQETFDKEAFKDRHQLYLKNCNNMHIDFNKEQLFNRLGDSAEDAKTGSKKASGSFKKMMNVVKKIFKNIFSFGSGKELSKEEFKTLPSQRYLSGDDEEDGDDKEEALDSDNGSSKGNKKAAKNSKSWLSGIKDVIESFKRLANDPLGTIYVNEYIMTAFRSSVTGKGEYASQINLRFQDKNTNPKADDLKLESEIEYIIAGERSDTGNNKDIALKIMMLRVLPNLLYVFTGSDTTALASSLATAITAIFPPIYPLVYVVICVLWAIAESVVDVFVLRLGQKVAFLKSAGDFLLAPSGFARIAQIFAEAAISGAADAAKKGIEDGIKAMDEFVTEKTEQAKQYITGQVEKMADAIGDKLKLKEIEEFVSDKYQVVESAVSDLEKSLDNYVEAVVGKYLVMVEKYRAQAEKLGDSNWVKKIDKKGLINSLMNSTVMKGLQTAAQGNLGETLMGKLNDKLLAELEPEMPSAAEIIKKLKEDGDIKSLLKDKKDELRKKMEAKLNEVVFDPITKEINEKKDQVKEDVAGYLNTKVEEGADQLQEYYNEHVQSVLTEAAGKNVSTTEKASSGFKLGYEDYLRMYLIFTPEDLKMFRILDLVQLREGKQLSDYMAGVKIEIGFNVPYLFLPRLIQIAKKQSSAITVNESDYERVDFRLRTVAGY